MLTTLKKYCDALSPSGMEQEIRDIIIADIAPYCEYEVDPCGNLIAFKKGKKRRDKKVVFAAHMDEVGFMVSFIDEDGYIYFGEIGGIDRRVVSGRRVTFCESGVKGVVASKAIHLQPMSERGICEPVSSMRIDIGCTSREEAEKYVGIGDCCVFSPNYEEFGDGFIRSKALDDRFGCAVLVSMIKEELEYDTYFAFNTCEEVGCDGALEVAYRLRPDVAVIIEATTAGDMPGTPKHRRACALREGAVLSFMDGGTIYNRPFFDYACKLAEEKGIKYQAKNVVAGGNEARAFQSTGSGAKVLAISAPTRYIHSESNVLCKDDITAVRDLAWAINEGSLENV